MKSNGMSMNLNDAYARVRKFKSEKYYDKEHKLLVKWEREPGVPGRVVLEGEQGIYSELEFSLVAIESVSPDDRLNFEEYNALEHFCEVIGLKKVKE